VIEPGLAAYSDLAVAEDGTIYCLFETGHTNVYETITFVAIDPAWLAEGS
jgi:hypothetical protein